MLIIEVYAVRCSKAPLAPSILNNTGQLARGECTFILKVLLDVKSSADDSVSLLPPQGCPAFLTIFNTLLLVLTPPEKGFANTVVAPPSKSVIV